MELFDFNAEGSSPIENGEYLTQQLVTYIGNKRALLRFIGQAVDVVKKRLHKDRITFLDGFSGCGIVSRYARQHSELVICNDIEQYAEIISRCYQSNKSDLPLPDLRETYAYLKSKLTEEQLLEGFITRLYAPEQDGNIEPGERVFYTRRNAMYLDTARGLLKGINQDYLHLFLAPLLSEASIHANTSGVFKGFYKNSITDIGQFGGNNCDALQRIKADISLQFPVLSNFECASQVFREDINTLVGGLEEVDLAYFDPPYNQHPYGSNYFMLNLLVEYKEPGHISKVSGIPTGWQRSDYNKKSKALNSFTELIEKTKAKYILVSFNSEGFIGKDEMVTMLKRHGKVEFFETRYNTFRGSRNLRGRSIHVSEHLFLLEK
ncbi:MAG: DNA adenine methylase [Chloroflexi bacterium]|nr:DNA adenine methylase [Chloroflexota bacterium]